MNDEIRTARETLRHAIADAEIRIEALFVPWSKSRNVTANPKLGDRSLNWHVTVIKSGHAPFSTDYSMGIGHCPSYKQGESVRPASVDYAQRIINETETGHNAAGRTGRLLSRPIPLDIVDVMAGLLMDSDALDYARFEDWAADLGFDTDSRRGEQIYRRCLEIALALRNMLGDAELARLRELAREL